MSEGVMAKRIILFGGTFDPVHLGHTAVIRHVASHLRADEVFFIPARRSPHKLDVPLAPAEHRIKMLALATGEYPSFSISDCEISRPEPSYTFDTVMEFKTKSPDATFFWPVGADAIPSLSRWYRFKDLLNLCEICIMSRGGIDAPEFDLLAPSLGQAAVDRLKKAAIATPLVPISSTEVRTRLAAGQDVSTMLHPAVLRYIRQNGLYGCRNRV
jgi:nicotinate-nucleotide adenylyltransferase